MSTCARLEFPAAPYYILVKVGIGAAPSYSGKFCFDVSYMGDEKTLPEWGVVCRVQFLRVEYFSPSRSFRQGRIPTGGFRRKLFSLIDHMESLPHLISLRE